MRLQEVIKCVSELEEERNRYKDALDLITTNCIWDEVGRYTEAYNIACEALQEGKQNESTR